MSDVAVLVVDDNPDHRELTRLALCECCDPARIATAASERFPVPSHGTMMAVFDVPP